MAKVHRLFDWTAAYGPEASLDDDELEFIEDLRAEGLSLARVSLVQEGGATRLRKSGKPKLLLWGESLLHLGRRLVPGARPTQLSYSMLQSGAMVLFDDGDVIRGLAASKLAMRVTLMNHPLLTPQSMLTMNNLAEATRLTGDLPTARAMLESSYVARQAVYGPRHRRTLLAGSNLACLMARQGEHDAAMALQVQIRDLSRIVLGERDVDTLRCINNVGGMLRESGDLRQAAKVMQDALDMRRAVLGERNKETLISWSALGSIHLELGDFQHARELLDSAYAAQADLLSEGHPDALETAGSLATLLSYEGNYAAALEMFRKVHDIWVEIAGETHPSTLSAAVSIAVTFSECGESIRAREIFDGLLDRCRRILGPEHNETLRVANGLAVLLCQQGDYGAALKIHEENYDIRLRSLGAGHKDTLPHAINLGSTLYQLGEFERAAALQASTLAASRAIYGAGNAHTLDVESHLASTLSAQGKLVDARALQESTHESHVRLYGSSHQATLGSANNLAATLDSLGDEAAAKKIFSHIFEQHGGQFLEGNLRYLVSANNYANALVNTGDSTAAIDLLRKVYETCSRSLDPAHWLILASGGRLASLLFDKQYFSEARELRALLHESASDRLGPEHPETLRAALQLSSSLASDGDLASAILIQESVCSSIERTLGGDHPDHLRSLSSLAETHARLGEYAVCAEVCVDIVSRMCRSAITNETCFDIAATLPFLIEPTAPWPSEELGQFVALLPRLSNLLGAKLESLPVESWERPYALFEVLHSLWMMFASHHAPEQLLPALAALHGLRSWSQVRAHLAEVKRVADLAEGARSDVAAEYVQAREQLNALRTRISDLSIRYGAAATALPDLNLRERNATERRARAETALAQIDPSLAATLGIGQAIEVGEIMASLQSDEAWLTFLADSNWVYLLRNAHPPEWFELEHVDALIESSDAFAVSARANQRGTMRDGFVPGVEEGGCASESFSAERLSAVAIATFWSPMEARLVGVRRLHFVTHGRYHGLMVEGGLPGAVGDREVVRYCGLPAYVRSVKAVQSDAGRCDGQHWFWLADEAGGGSSPIPFTRLDALLPVRQGLMSEIDAARLREAASGGGDWKLLVSAHGCVSGSGSAGGGHVVFPGGLRLDTHTLASMPSPIGQFISLSCWGARVGGSAYGDPYGSMGALQLHGLRSAVGCLAPVADFYAPLLSAFIWHHVLEGTAMPTALARAKASLRHGPWDEMEEMLVPVRRGYGELMHEVLERVSYRPADHEGNAYAQKLLPSLAGWSLPAPWRRLFDGEEVSHLLSELRSAQTPPKRLDRAHAALAMHLPQDAASRDRLVDQCLDVAFRAPEQRDLSRIDDLLTHQSIEALCSVTVCFGAGIGQRPN